MSSVLYDVPGPKARRVSLIGSVVGSLLIAGLLAWVISILAQQGIFEGRRWAIFTRADVWSLIGNGIGATLSAAAVAAVIAFPLGLLLCLLRISDVPAIRIPTRIVLEFLRGMPVVLMMLFVLLVFGTNQFLAVVAGLVLYNAAVFAEIIRAGIQSLPKGQREAGLTIGLTSFQSRMMIELPQAVRRMMPSLVAQLVVLLKDTSLGYIVGYVELLRVNMNQLATFYGNRYLFSFFIVTLVLYLIMNLSLSWFARWLSKRTASKSSGTKLDPDDPNQAILVAEASAAARQSETQHGGL